MKDHKLVPLRPPESILAVVRKAYGNATAYDVGHVWHEIYTRLPDAAPAQEPVAYLMKHGQWSTNIETDEGMWLLEQFPSEDVQIPVYLAAQSPQGEIMTEEHSIGYQGGWNAAVEAQPQQAPVQEPSHDVVAGAIFDFAGFLTSHKDKIEAGTNANAGPMVERIREWSGKRGLSIENPDVFGWQMRAVQPSKAVKLTDDEILTALDVEYVSSAQNRGLFLSDARTIEAAVWAKLGVEPCQ